MNELIKEAHKRIALGNIDHYTLASYKRLIEHFKDETPQSDPTSGMSELKACPFCGGESIVGWLL